MLVLTRKVGEEIVIGENIRVTVVEVGPGRVKIGIAAPRDVKIDRDEIRAKKDAEIADTTPVVHVNRIAAHVNPVVTPAPVGLLENRVKSVRIRQRPKTK